MKGACVPAAICRSWASSARTSAGSGLGRGGRVACRHPRLRRGDDLDTIDGFDFVGAADDDSIAALVYRSSGGGTVSANLMLEQYSVGGAGRCLVAGSAVVAS